MVREEKVGERECEGERGGEGMARKWREGLLVGNSCKRAGPSTPPPVWRLEFSPPPRDGASSAVDSKQFLNIPAEASARKLCADLWEMEQFRSPIMPRGLRKLRRVHRRDKVEEEAHVVYDGPPHDHQPLSTGSLRRQISTKLGPNHRQVQRSGHVVEPVSPATSSSSLEVAACKRAFIPTDSLECKSPSYSVKTSTKLLKVLNRIWSLEEQHLTNMSMVKALKTELERCRGEVKELQQEKHMDRDGTNEVKENVSVRRRMEQDKLREAIQSVREELENERRLRRRSHGLHQKLEQELRQVKRCFAKTVTELERERRARVLLENLCDEFAGAVKEYEDDVRRVAASKSPRVERENVDRLIVHVAEAWLDERVQMKSQEDEEDSLGKNSIVDKLGLDIETFLRARRSHGSRTEEKSRSRSGFGKNCGEGKQQRYLDLNKSSSRRQGKGGEKSADSDHAKQRVCSVKLEKAFNTQNPHERSDNHMATSNDRFQEKETRRDNQLQILRDLCGGKSECVGETRGHGLDQALDCVIRNQSVSSEGIKIHPEICPNEDEPKHCGSHQPRNIKEDSLHAKLIEARLESRRSRS